MLPRKTDWRFSNFLREKRLFINIFADVQDERISSDGYVSSVLKDKVLIHLKQNVMHVFGRFAVNLRITSTCGHPRQLFPDRIEIVHLIELDRLLRPSLASWHVRRPRIEHCFSSRINHVVLITEVGVSQSVAWRVFYSVFHLCSILFHLPEEMDEMRIKSCRQTMIRHAQIFLKNAKYTEILCRLPWNIKKSYEIEN